jgi:elongator complex protein 2
MLLCDYSIPPENTYIESCFVQDEYDRGTLQTLSGHTNMITGTRFVFNDLLLSVDEGGMLFLWKRDDLQWKEVLRIQAHQSSISTLCVFKNLLITGSSDSELKVWEFGTGSENLSEIQNIPLRGKYPLSLSCARLPRSHATILAVGCTSREIQIWIKSERVFVESASLPGHEDWIRSLAFNPATEESLVLASGSQDSTIRLWNIEPFENSSQKKTSSNHVPDDLLDAFEASLGDLGDTEEGGRQISLKRHLVTVRSNVSSEQFSISFDALLVGHESAINSLAWQQGTTTSITPTLLSSSADSSAILWSPSNIISSQNETTSLWINRQRFGDVGGQRLGGFIQALWAADGTEILAHGWSGGWRRWKCTHDDEWTEIGAISGHNGPAKDIDWSPNGEYLLSVG